MPNFMKATIASAVMACCIGSAFSEEMRFVQRVAGIKPAQEVESPPEVEEEEAPEILEPATDYLLGASYDFSKSSGMMVTEEVSGVSYDFSSAYKLDEEGKPALVPKTARNLFPTHSFNNSSEWDIAVDFAPPYITPTTASSYVTDLRIVGSATIRSNFGIYRNGARGDGFIREYPSGKHHRATIEEGYTNGTWIDGVSFYQKDTNNLIRVQREIAEPIERIRWNRTGDRVYIYLNGALFADYVADPTLDVLDGPWIVLSPFTSNGGYVNANLLIRSLKISAN